MICDERSIIIVTTKGLEIWGFKRNKIESKFKGQSLLSKKLVVSRDFKYLVTGYDSSLKLWSFNDKALEAKLDFHHEWKTSIIIARDNKYVVACSVIIPSVYGKSKKVLTIDKINIS